MNKYLIRFNRRKGEPGRGTEDHAWRVFENEKEYLFKHLKINVPITDEQIGPDYNICCHGILTIDKDTSTAIINSEQKKVSFEERTFGNHGYVQSKLSFELLEKIKDEIKNLNHNLDNAIPYNKNLAGNIEKEFMLPLSTEIEHFLIDMANFYLSKFYLEHKGTPQILSTWVNMMKKHEFNPLHVHTPLDGLSYVIWVNIPYNTDLEKSTAPSVSSNAPSVSDFQFIYTDILGNIRTENISPTKDWAGTIIMFPSRLSHLVYPFYTSDDHRISVAGNIGFSS